MCVCHKVVFGVFEPPHLSYTYSFMWFLILPCYLSLKLVNSLSFDKPHYQMPAFMLHSVSSLIFFWLVALPLPNAISSGSGLLIPVSIVMFLYSSSLLDVFRRKSSHIETAPLHIADLSEWDTRPRIYAKICASHKSGKKRVVTHRSEHNIEYFDCIDKTLIPGTPRSHRYHLSPVVVLELTQQLQQHICESLKRLYQENKHLDTTVEVSLHTSAHTMVQDVYVGIGAKPLKYLVLLEKFAFLTMLLVPFYVIRAMVFPVVPLVIRKKLTHDVNDLKSVSYPLIYALKYDLSRATLPPYREMNDFEKFSGYKTRAPPDNDNAPLLSNLKRMRRWHRASGTAEHA